jgi:hypothetical protein
MFVGGDVASSAAWQPLSKAQFRGRGVDDGARGGRDHAASSASPTGPDDLVPRLFRMRGEMIAHTLLKVGGDVDGHGVEPPHFGFELSGWMK